ncbi:hypothetical protein ACIG87_24045 [Micromonospora sp. NPDC051925]|uniref:hypothetical protein n=1 Tax=Micromonospora sp. NPDC051925 TaxID=3364288 RepID=UPI0037C98C5F
MLKRLALVVIAAALLAGCGSAPGSEIAAQPEGQTDLSASRVKDYATLAELRAQSTAIVRGTVESSTRDKLEDLPVTISKVRVREVLWGKVSSDVLAVQQVGDETMKLHDTGAILAKDREYLLFVQPFQLKPGELTGRWLITGDQGTFARSSDGHTFQFAGAGDPPELPRTVSATAVETGTFLN